MGMNGRLLVPYLMGQRRNGLRRVLDIDAHCWEVIAPDTLNADRVDDAQLRLNHMGQLYALLAERVTAVVRSGMRPVSVAGDCVSSLGMLAGLRKAGCVPDRVLWLDAHGDFHTWATSQTQYIGGMPLAMLVGRIDAGPDPRNQAVRDCLACIGAQAYPESQIVLADARDLDPGEREALWASKILRVPLEEALAQLRTDERLYVHWDTDVIDDQARMPALKYHVKQGPSADDVLQLFKALQDYDVRAVSVSAWHAEQDVGDLTARRCMKLLEALVGD